MLDTPRSVYEDVGSLIAALDIGTTKICCFIARVEDDNPRVLGIGHQISRGMRNGAIVDLETTTPTSVKSGSRSWRID